MRAQAHNLRVVRGDRAVVDGVDLSVVAGRVTAIVGPNGAGKTTVLKAMLGLVASTGSICVDDRDMRSLSPRERARRLAYVPQRSLLSAALPARDVVALARFASGVGDRSDDPAVAAALARVRASHLADRPFNQLSGGEQRLVLIARALCGGAPVIFLDEPTSSLDVGRRLEICLLMRSLAAEGFAIVCVLHELDDARRFADSVVFLSQGRVVGREMTSELVRSVYGVDARERDGLGYYPLGVE